MVKRPKRKQPTLEWPHPDIGDRLRRVRLIALDHEGKGFPNHGDQKRFAEYYGFAPGSWNQWEKGASMPWPQACRLVDKIAGLTLDYIYLGRFGGLPFDLAARLRAPRD